MKILQIYVALKQLGIDRCLQFDVESKKGKFFEISLKSMTTLKSSEKQPIQSLSLQKQSNKKQMCFVLIQGYIHKNYLEYELISSDIINIIVLFYHIVLNWKKEWTQSEFPIEYLSDNKVKCHGRTQLFADYTIKSDTDDIYSWNIIFDKIDSYIEFGFVRVTDDDKPDIIKQGYDIGVTVSKLSDNRGYVSYFSCNSIMNMVWSIYQKSTVYYKNTFYAQLSYDY